MQSVKAFSLTVSLIYFFLKLYLVLAISTGIEAAVVTKPDIIELTKCNVILFSKYPIQIYKKTLSQC